MFDTHFDLMTIAYKAYLTNDYSYLEKISHYFHDHNVRGVFANCLATAFYRRKEKR